MIAWLAVCALAAGPIPASSTGPGTAYASGIPDTDSARVLVPGRAAPGARASWAVAPAASGEAGVAKASPAVPADRWLAEDKARHFAMSFAATGMSYGAARLALEPATARATAVGAAVAMGIGKELWDVARGGPFSVKDLVWDALGVALGHTLVQRME